MLTVSNVEVSIGGSRILRGVSLEGPPNSVVCLMGRNGVGKTTTLKTIVGLLKPNNGSVGFYGENLTNKSPDLRARHGIGYVPQGREIFPHLTVEENLKIAQLGCGRADRMDDVLDLFPALRRFLGRKGGVLSGGEQQMLALGRALLTRPKLLLLDEPTKGIQP